LPERTKDELLFERAVGGDQTAFLQLYEEHRKAIFRFAYRILGSRELAEDITHDCFLSLIRKPESFDSARASLRTYLYAAARNLSLKHFRDFGRETAIEELTAQPAIPVSEEPLAKLLDAELALKVQEAVSSLPPLQREALVLYEYEGLTLNEIASVVGADVGAVKARLHRARQRLKNKLRAYLNTSREIVTLEKA